MLLGSWRVLAVALVGGRTISALALGPIRRSVPFRGGAAAKAGDDRWRIASPQCTPRHDIFVQ